jgi:hypothetical protein
MRFQVTGPNFEQSFERWIDALEAGKSQISTCKGLFQEVRILEEGKLVWLYDRFHRHPQFFGAGTYNRLARLFLAEASQDLAESDATESDLTESDLTEPTALESSPESPEA